VEFSLDVCVFGDAAFDITVELFIKHTKTKRAAKTLHSKDLVKKRGLGSCYSVRVGGQRDLLFKQHVVASDFDGREYFTRVQVSYPKQKGGKKALRVNNAEGKIYYAAHCWMEKELKGMDGFLCNADALSVITKPIVVDKNLTIKDTLFIKGNYETYAHAFALDVKGSIKFEGDVVFQQEKGYNFAADVNVTKKMLKASGGIIHDQRHKIMVGVQDPCYRAVARPTWGSHDQWVEIMVGWDQTTYCRPRPPFPVAWSAVVGLVVSLVLIVGALVLMCKGRQEQIREDTVELVLSDAFGENEEEFYRIINGGDDMEEWPQML
jgi:hypothetical protein